MRKFRRGSASAYGITEGVIWVQLLVFFLPILMGTFLQQLYNTADAIIVGTPPPPAPPWACPAMP